ncbi:MAG TPA: acetylglutamate kinase [Sandaracinaceae bacterium LLY-WYZ-13_1]|nr:acetylglutamate kinase [Sandaracinaceae bacterium LLY-WYZ-13_1]
MVQQLIEKAAILHEALPYIQRFHGRTFVVKYGGHAMVDAELRDSFARDITLMRYVGLNPIVVHGGGPQIDELLKTMGVVSERIDGLRVTDERTMEVVEMVLGGKINQEIVSLICTHGGRAVGLSGKDDGFLLAERVPRMKTKSGKSVDPGRVGRVVEVRTRVVTALVAAGFIPVIAPVAVDTEGRSLNVNADTVAGAVASALEAEKLVLMTDTEGIRGRDGAVSSSLSAAAIERLVEDDVIAGGMIPKVRCGLEALEAGVGKVHVIDGRRRHACLLEIFTDRGVGTEITR